MCKKSQQTPFHILYSGGDTTTASRVFHDITGPINSNDLVYVRPSRELRNNSGEASVEFAVRYSDDGETWDAPNAFGPASSTTDGWTYGSSFTDISTGHGTRKLYGQIGFWVKNNTGTAIEFVEARAILDFSDD